MNIFKEFDNSESIFYYSDNFLSQEEQEELYKELIGIEMETYPNSTRQMCWFDMNNRNYKFSNVNLQSRKFSLILLNIKEKVNDYVNKHFKKTNYESLLINKYNGKYSGLGWHADNEPCIPEDSIIVSISLGDERDFEIKRMSESEREFEYKKINTPFVKNLNEQKDFHRFKLKCGSIFIMAGSAQKFWYHQLPKYSNKKDNNDIRFNLTFREYKN
jgi:alkylated DNA repair dioxygenase AlkB